MNGCQFTYHSTNFDKPFERDPLQTKTTTFPQTGIYNFKLFEFAICAQISKNYVFSLQSSR